MLSVDELHGGPLTARDLGGSARADAREACFAEWDAIPAAFGNERSPSSADGMSAARQGEEPKLPQTGRLEVDRRHGHDHCAIRGMAQAHSQGGAAQPENGNEFSSSLGRAWLTVFGLIACFFVFKAAPWPSRPHDASSTPAAQVARRSNGDARQPDFVPIRIQDVKLGRRLAGTNPLREQADEIEPDPPTWRTIRFHMRKESGLSLWIGLLRPLAWVESNEIEQGKAIFLDMHEMGAVGDAEVTYLGPCPGIKPGRGTVVTGTFKHEADETSNVVLLKLEGQVELTGVTGNHAYWSVDRQDFVEVGNLRIGELVDTESGSRHVLSVTPIEYTGFLYNLETTEHVYRVGSLGTLVHNSCLVDNLRKSGSYGDPGADAHHIVARLHSGAKPARAVLIKHGINIDDAMNGVWLPKNSQVSRARGALHREAGSALTSKRYLNEVNRRILAADADGGRALVLREMQTIRYDLLNGTFPGVTPNF